MKCVHFKNHFDLHFASGTENWLVPLAVPRFPVARIRTDRFVLRFPMQHFPFLLFSESPHRLTTDFNHSYKLDTKSNRNHNYNPNLILYTACSSKHSTKYSYMSYASREVQKRHCYCTVFTTFCRHVTLPLQMVGSTQECLESRDETEYQLLSVDQSNKQSTRAYFAVDALLPIGLAPVVRY